jgi:hypothetical protein
MTLWLSRRSRTNSQRYKSRQVLAENQKPGYAAGMSDPTLPHAKTADARLSRGRRGREKKSSG